jgi:O-antigen ligase
MWQGIKEKPLFGWGQGNQRAVYDKYHTDEITALEAPADRAHNTLIDLFVTSGVLGLASYLAIWVIVMLKLFKRHDKIAVMIACGLIAYFIHNLFVFDTIVSYMGFYTILAYVDGMEEVPVKHKKRKRGGEQ